MTEQRKSLGILLEESFTILARHIFFLVKATLSVYIPLLLLSFVFVFFSGITTAGKSPGTINPVAAVQWFLWAVVFFLAMTIVSLFYQIVILKAVMMAERGEESPVGPLWKEAWTLLNKYLKVVFWVMLKVFLWSLLLIIPGIVFAVFYSYATFAFIADGQEGRQALVHSKNVVRAGVGKLIGNMLVVSVIVLPVYLIVSFVVGLVFGHQGPSLMPVVGPLLGNIMNAVIGLYPLIFSYLLYLELKRRMESKAPLSVSG